MNRPLLVVGDIQGDYERLLEALSGYPEDEVDTIFLGDFFQGGRRGAGGGAQAAQIARSRRNSRAVMGNHDLFALAMLDQRRSGVVSPWISRDGRRLEEVWLDRRGDWADLDAVADDAGLEAWLRDLPLLIKLTDGTLLQHADDDAAAEVGDSVEAVNRTWREWLSGQEGLLTALRLVIGRRAFIERDRVDAYLRHFSATRVVHGHTPHGGDAPLSTHQGRVWSFDGRFSRYWMEGSDIGLGPIGATVALLPPLSGPG